MADLVKSHTVGERSTTFHLSYSTAVLGNQVRTEPGVTCYRVSSFKELAHYHGHYINYGNMKTLVL